MATVQEYLAKCHSNISTNKTVCLVFHNRNYCAGYQLKVESFPGNLLFQNNPTFLCLTLDRSLPFKGRILKLINKAAPGAKRLAA